MPKRNVATNFTFEQQRQEINLIAADLWDGVLGGSSTDFSTVVGWGDHNQAGYLKADGTVATTAAFTFGNKIIGPSTFTIEPTNVNGTVVIAGNLQVDGTQTAVNSTTMDVTDLNITVAKGAANSAAADTAGITVDGANATLQYEDGSPGTWESSLGFRLDGRNASAGLKLNLAGSADYLIRESTTDDIVQFGGTGAANFFAHNLSSGNIGIAEANPSHKLDVNGTLRVTGNATFDGNISCVAGTFFKSSGQAQVNVGSGNAGGALIALDGDSNGDVSGGDFSYLKHDTSGDLIIAAGNPNNDSDIKFQTSDSATLALTLAGYNATFGGNVTIQRGSTDNADLLIGATGSGEARIYLDASNGDFSGGDYGYFKQTDAGLLKIGNMNGGGIQFLVGEGAGGAGNALEIINDGKIGIGKTPGANLDIAATNTTSIGTHGFRLGAFGIRTEDVDNYNVWAIEKNYGGWGSAVVLQASGRVGIGTGTAATELDALLTIKGDSNGDSVPSIRLKDGADSRECWMSNVSGDLYLVNGGNDNAYHSRIRLMDGRAIYFDIDGASGAPFSVDANGVYDSKGKIRRIPRNEPTSGTAYTLVNSDMGKFISHGATVIMAANSTFATGDAITIYNYSGSAITIDASTNSATLHWTDGTTAATGDRTLASRGVATLLCVEGSNNTWVITGSLT